MDDRRSLRHLRAHFPPAALKPLASRPGVPGEVTIADQGERTGGAFSAEPHLKSPQRSKRRRAAITRPTCFEPAGDA
jgi:hypothetical protein